MSAEAARFASIVDPAQQTVFAPPRPISDAERDEVVTALRTELPEHGFVPRQIAEIEHIYRGYVALTQRCQEFDIEAAGVEGCGQGLRAAVNELVAAARRAGVRVRAPKTVTRKSIDRIWLKCLRHSDGTTRRISGNGFVMLCAIALKAFLLMPLADLLLQDSLKDEDALRGIASLVLAAVMAYAITFVARLDVQLLVGEYGSETAKQQRWIGDLLSPTLRRVLLAVVSFFLFGVLASFLFSDLANTKIGLVGTVGLDLLFIAILIVFELFSAYRSMVRQVHTPSRIEEANDLHHAALIALDNEVDLAKQRTLGLSGQQAWIDFELALDSGKLKDNAVKRAQAYAQLLESAVTWREKPKPSTLPEPVREGAEAQEASKPPDPVATPVARIEPGESVSGDGDDVPAWDAANDPSADAEGTILGVATRVANPPVARLAPFKPKRRPKAEQNGKAKVKLS